MQANILTLFVATGLGAAFGLMVSLAIIGGFAEMILSSFFNAYYATIFFIVGSYYTYKIIKKNQIQLSLENDNFLIRNPKSPFLTPGYPEESSTGGSTYFQFPSTTEPPLAAKEKLFQRPPLITETKALYQQSYVLSDAGNNWVNRVNSMLEVVLTIGIFVSSFLVLSIEKYWWGGYLTNSPPYAHWHRLRHHHFWQDYK